MPHLFQLALVFLAGAALGALFFGGLAWTVRRLVAGGGAMLVLGSFLLRSAALLAAFWLLARNRPQYWIACLLGFTAARVVLSQTVIWGWWGRRESEHASHH